MVRRVTIGLLDYHERLNLSRTNRAIILKTMTAATRTIIPADALC